MGLPAPGGDRAAIVTGASSGIGEAMAVELARRGHQVVLVARRADRLESLAARLDSKAHPLPADLSCRKDRAALVSRVARLGVTPNILVNNAGLSSVAAVAESSPDQQLNLVEVDVAAVVDLCSRFLPAMVQRRGGAVLNVASLAGFGPLPGQAAYGAAKAFVLSYTTSLRGELRGTGVVATALCPGPVVTELDEASGFGKGEREAALPRLMWQTADTVARAGIDGLATNKRLVVPGRINQLAATFYRVVPHELMLSLLAKRAPLATRH